MGTFEEFGRKTDVFVEKAQKKTLEWGKEALKHASVFAAKASEGARNAASRIEHKLRTSEDNAAEGNVSAAAEKHTGVNLNKEDRRR